MTEVAGVAADQLLSLIERIERVTEEKDGLTEDIKQLFLEAAGNGFDKKAIRRVLYLRTLSKDNYQALEHMIDLYKLSLDMG